MSELIFVAPVDVAAANIRIIGPAGQVNDFLATPLSKRLTIPEASPGYYQAIIEPLGQPWVTFSFEIPAAGAAFVQAPRFAELNMRAADLSVAEAFIPDVIAELPESEASNPFAHFIKEKNEVSYQSELNTAKAITLGLSSDTRPGRPGGWAPYNGPPPRVDLTPTGGLDIVFEDIPRANSNVLNRSRVRLSIAIADTRVERLLIPSFTGGTRIIFRALGGSAADLSARVWPLNPERRALAQVLLLGNVQQAHAVLSQYLSPDESQQPVGQGTEDVWTEILLAHLGIRFPELIIPERDWISAAEGSWSWITDVHVLAARQVLLSTRDAQANPRPEDKRKLAADRALDLLSRARRVGAPYFAQSSSVMGQLLNALASSRDHYQQANREMTLWDKDFVFRRNCGIAFSWVLSSLAARQGRELSSSTVYAPVKDGLKPNYSWIFFHGEVDLAEIRPRSPSRNATYRGSSLNKRAAHRGGREVTVALTDPPSSRRPIIDPKDPNKGRFGGLAQRAGFILDVRFKRQRGAWVDFVLSVRAEPNRVTPFVDYVDFFLHDTFDPQCVRAVFQGSSAEIPVAAWGGFTVGAWLPGQAIELELDLSTVEGAPKAIREL
jgi:hypothetical protein